MAPPQASQLPLLARDAGAEPLALDRCPGIRQHAFEVPHHEIAHQRGPGLIEKAAPVVRRHSVGQRAGAEVDVADEGETHGGIHARRS